MEKEVWKDYNGNIEELNGHIRVSNLGRVYRVSPGKTSSKPRILVGTTNNQGYKRLHVSIDGVTYNKPIHRLVAEMFCDNPEEKPYVDHINAIRDDNRATNLRWVTSSENNKNPNYREKLSIRSKNALRENNYLSEANKKRCFAENISGETHYFSSITELKESFDTNSNVKRKINTGEYFTSSRSKLKGWRIWTVER